MATPIADIYSVDSGQPVYAGRLNYVVSGVLSGDAALNSLSASGQISDGAPIPVPSWMPPAGYFADVPMINTAESARNGNFSTGEANSAFAFWGGSAWLRNMGLYGSQVYHAGGHESSGASPNVQMALRCDFETLTWTSSNGPVDGYNASSTFDANGWAPDGTPYAPHTYMGLHEFPAAWGGSDTKMARFFFAGSGWENRIIMLDVSQFAGGYTQFATTQPANTVTTKIAFGSGGTLSTGSYPAVVQDDVRQGWWACKQAVADYMLFIAADGTITQHAPLNGNMQQGALVLAPSLGAEGSLIVLDGGYDPGGRWMAVRDLATGVTTSFNTIGEVPGRTAGYDGPDMNFHDLGRIGLHWVEELGAIYGMDDDGTIVKLTPPISDPQTTAWTWSIVSIAHWSADTSGYPTLRVPTAAAWSKFRWIPSLQAFVVCTGAPFKPQVIKL